MFKRRPPSTGVNTSLGEKQEKQDCKVRIHPVETPCALFKRRVHFTLPVNNRVSLIPCNRNPQLISRLISAGKFNILYSLVYFFFFLIISSQILLQIPYSFLLLFFFPSLPPPLNSVHPSGTILISSFDFNLFARFLTEQMATTSLKDNYPSVKNFFAINSPAKGTVYCQIYSVWNFSSILSLSPLANFDYIPPYISFTHPMLIDWKIIYSLITVILDTPLTIYIKTHHCFSNQERILLLLQNISKRIIAFPIKNSPPPPKWFTNFLFTLRRW